MSARKKATKSPEEMLQDARNMILKTYEQLGGGTSQKQKRGAGPATVLPPYDIVWEAIDRLHRALSILDAVPLPDEPDLDEDEDEDFYDDYDDEDFELDDAEDEDEEESVTDQDEDDEEEEEDGEEEKD